MTNKQLIESCAQAVRLHKSGIIDAVTMTVLLISYESFYLANKVVM